jgi:glycosyltransferase involved in cell wall biosynthesis
MSVNDRMPRLLFLITEDWYFWSHRLDLARAMRDAGFDVTVATRVQAHETSIRQEGFRLLPIQLLRRSRNPMTEYLAIRELVHLYRRERPDIVHHVAMKPILYGSIAARLANVRIVVNAFPGLGHVFATEGRTGRLLRALVRVGLRWVLARSGSTIVVQNSSDRNRLIIEGIVEEDRTRVIRGSGVNTDVYVPRSTNKTESMVLLASRMLWDKGIGEFVQAVRQMRSRRKGTRFVLVGRCDEDNPARVAREQLIRWNEEGVIEWWGHREDMPAVLAAATVVVLPTYYGEGIPKVLLEAAASGVAIVATDIPGCREVVRHRVNGLLVPARNVEALTEAIETLLDDEPLRQELGREGREIAKKEFSTPIIAEEFLSLYRELLNQTAMKA